MRHSDFIEHKKRGSSDLPIQLYRINDSHPEYFMPLHWHRELEIVRVLSGSMELYINNTPYTLLAGDIAFINCKVLHRGVPKNCFYECVVADLGMLVKKGNTIFSSYIDPIVSGDVSMQTLLHNDNSKLYASVNSLFTVLSAEKPYYELSVMSILFGIFDMLYSAGLIDKTNSTNKSGYQTAAVAELVRWIDDNHTEQITLPILADKAGVSPNYLCRVFKEYTGKTPIEYVNSVRIENFCYEVLQSDKNITELALCNGYNDLSYFCRVFKKHKGVSAKKYISTINQQKAPSI